MSRGLRELKAKRSVEAVSTPTGVKDLGVVCCDGVGMGLLGDSG